MDYKFPENIAEAIKKHDLIISYRPYPDIYYARMLLVDTVIEAVGKSPEQALSELAKRLE